MGSSENSISQRGDFEKRRGASGACSAQNLHLTLAFIGEYDHPARVKEVLERVPMPPLRLSLSDPGNFGSLLWAGVKGNQKLKTYVKDLRAALKAAEIPFSDDAFVPHITLVRKASCRKPYQPHLPKAEMTAREAALMRSEQKEGKRVYREV